MRRRIDPGQGQLISAQMTDALFLTTVVDGIARTNMVVAL